jgi:U3 small nucleolar RNA-associated protein 25
MKGENSCGGMDKGFSLTFSSDKKRDYDFLSSVELVVVDQAEALMQQNWDHVEHIFKHMNLIPKDSHGCDFARVRNWYLDSQAKYLRQTIVLSQFITPELNSLSNAYMHNIAGKVKIFPTYHGAIGALGLQVKQQFLRFDSSNLSTDPDTRFKFFTKTILPQLQRTKQKGILLFIPSYFDFIRLRNHFANLAVPISFGCVSEETSPSDITRARSHFNTGRHEFLLYSGRAHHFRRLIIRGVKKVVFYSLPDNPEFYKEAAGDMLLKTLGAGEDVNGVMTLFSKWDGLALERVVGSKRVGQMVMSKAGTDIFEFM